MDSKSIMILFMIACLALPANGCSGFISNKSTVTSVDSYRKNLLVEERFEKSISESNPYNKGNETFPFWHNSFKAAAYKSYSYTVNSTVKRNGSNAGRFEMRSADASIVRSEFIQNYQETGRNRWYGLSLYLPSANWATSKHWEVLTQFWSQPDAGESAHNPPISLVAQNGRYLLRVRWASAAMHTNTTIDGSKDFDLGPIEKDKWLDFVYHINYSYKSDGVLEVWMNGKKVVDYRGPNSYNDKAVPYFKFGIYRYSWDVSNRVMYVDEARIGNENATYADVAPSRKKIRE